MTKMWIRSSVHFDKREGVGSATQRYKTKNSIMGFTDDERFAPHIQTELFSEVCAQIVELGLHKNTPARVGAFAMAKLLTISIRDGSCVCIDWRQHKTGWLARHGQSSDLPRTFCWPASQWQLHGVTSGRARVSNRVQTGQLSCATPPPHKELQSGLAEILWA